MVSRMTLFPVANVPEKGGINIIAGVGNHPGLFFGGHKKKDWKCQYHCGKTETCDLGNMAGKRESWTAW